MRLAYADPPYYGQGHQYTDTPEAALRVYDDLDAWSQLIADLGEYDGWAMSMTSGNLFDILPLFDERPRIGAWLKPFAAHKANVRLAYTWEPILFKEARISSKTGAAVGHDSIIAEPAIAESITMMKGFTGAKPEKVCSWILDGIGWLPGDDFTDLFPGSGVMDRVVAARSGIPIEGQLDLFELGVSR